MKALTIRQPWAHLIIEGAKDVENRIWRTNYRGRVAIHTSARLRWDEWLAAEMKIIEARRVGRVVAPLPLAMLDTSRSVYRWKVCPDVPLGKVIGTVEIVDCVTSSKSPWFSTGCYGLVLKNPVKFKDPIPALGSLKFWEWKDEHLVSNPV